MGEEKRVFDRAELVVPVRVESGEQVVDGESVDLSVGGIRVALPDDLPFGAKVKVVVVLPSLGDESTFDADVRWSQKNPAGGFLLGLQFRRVRVRETWAINQLMRRS